MSRNRHFGNGFSYFGEDTKGQDVKAFGDTTGKYILWDASADKFIIVGGLSLDGTDLTATMAEINRACDTSARVVTVATTPLAITELAHDGKVIVLTKTDGQAVTLPAATGSGTMLRFIIGAKVASSATTINTSALDQVMTGNALQLADGGDTIGAYEAAATVNGISFDGSTTGGLKGDYVELIDIAAKTWFVRIVCAATGSEATPFVTRS